MKIIKKKWIRKRKIYLGDNYFNASVRVFSSTISSNLVSTQPLTQPKGLFYWFDILGNSSRLIKKNQRKNENNKEKI